MFCRPWILRSPKATWQLPTGHRLGKRYSQALKMGPKIEGGKPQNPMVHDVPHSAILIGLHPPFLDPMHLDVLEV